MILCFEWIYCDVRTCAPYQIPKVNAVLYGIRRLRDIATVDILDYWVLVGLFEAGKPTGNINIYGSQFTYKTFNTS